MGPHMLRMGVLKGTLARSCSGGKGRGGSKDGTVGEVTRTTAVPVRPEPPVCQAEPHASHMLSHEFSPPPQQGASVPYWPT